nr:adhesion G-protein coupled receptor G6-like [Lytechinus pictus]
METFDIITLIGAILSTVCCIGTVTTYSSFGDLRNISGLCLINVSLALLTLAIIFIATYFLVISGTSCVTIAILQQICWLGSFTWMSLQAVHMVRTFVLTNWQMPLGHPQNRQQWIKISMAHALMGWGLPMIYSVVLLYFHLCRDCLPGGVEFRLGKDSNSTIKYCWPGSTYLGNHLTIDPMLVLLAFNIVALLIIMIAIIKKRMMTRKVAGRDLKKEIAVNLLILAKLSISLGAMWLPVLLHRFLHHLVLMQIHVLLNSWLGVIIFMLFSTSQRIRRLWKGRFRCLCLTKADTSDLYRLRESSGSGKKDMTA